MCAFREFSGTVSCFKVGGWLLGSDCFWKWYLDMVMAHSGGERIVRGSAVSFWQRGARVDLGGYVAEEVGAFSEW